MERQYSSGLGESSLHALSPLGIRARQRVREERQRPQRAQGKRRGVEPVRQPSRDLNVSVASS